MNKRIPGYEWKESEIPARATMPEFGRMMSVGDSVFLTDKKKAVSIAAAIRRSGFRGIQQKQKGGYRVWKAEYNYLF